MSAFAYGGPMMDYVREVRAEQLRRTRAARAASVGFNILASISDLDRVFPWEKELRAFSPIVEKTSHLRAIYYRPGRCWVLYDGIPLALMPDDERKVRPDLTGAELFAAIRGRPQRMRSDDEEPSPISDLQHAMANRWKVWAGPYWALQGPNGGHQVKLDPWQQNLAIAKGLPAEMPALGSLRACPFDERVKVQLGRRNRLKALGDRLDKLQASGSVEYANAEMDKIQREIREAEMAFIEQQMTPIVDMVTSLARGANSRSEHMDQVIEVKNGMAARAADAYQQYRETGDWTMKNVTGHGI